MLALLVTLGATACKQRSPGPTSGAPTASSSAPVPATLPEPHASARAEPPRPLTAASGIVNLAVPGFPTAVVSLPLGATSRRPVVIAAHGNYDRPEWQCNVFRELFANRAFVLCPRGVARPDSPGPDDVRFTYESNATLEREIDAGLTALAAEYPDHVDPGPVVHAGFSLGAIQGVAIAGRRPARSPRLVLIEGGHASWKPEVVNVFAAGGGARVLFVCSQVGCEKDARWAAARLGKAGVPTRIVKSADVGHRYDGPVAEALRKALDWVLEGDIRFGEVDAGR